MSIIKPPKIPLIFLQWFCHPDLLEDIEGDLIELFRLRSQESKSKARMLFWLDVILLFRPGIIRNLHLFHNQTNYSMFRNYFKIAIRNSIRYKEYTLLNLLGLIIGISSSIVILLWINDEISVNRIHQKGDRIYQLFRNMQQSNGMVETTQSLPKPVGDLIKESYSEVAEVASLSWEIELKIELNDTKTTEEGRYATPSFLQMFSFPLIVGEAESALKETNSIVISESLARVLFGENWKTESVGQSLQMEDIYYGKSEEHAIVTGVFEDIPDQSTIQFDWLMPAEHYYNNNDWVEDWGNGSFSTFVTIPDKEGLETVKNRVLNEINNHTKENDKAGNEHVILHKFEDTYLYSNFDNGVVAGGRIRYVQIMSIVSILLLIVACINFMNLTTARANKRSREIGLRKVMGAQKKTISTQFYFEAFLFTIISVVLSVLVVLMVLPYFNVLVEKSLAIEFNHLNTWIFLGFIILIISFLSGSYPALLMPAFNIIQALKGGIKQSSMASYFRKGLVIFQFSISILLIIGTSVIYKQIQYVMNEDLGLDRDNIIAVTMQGDLPQRLKTYKTELLKISGVKQITGVSGNPINYGRSTSSATWEGKDSAEGYEINVIITDEDFISTMGMEMIAGRDFTKQINDSTNFIINEVAADLMGFEDPINKKLSFWGIDGKIVGVVKNFHMQDFYEPIAPVIITCVDPGMSYLALVKVDGNPTEALTGIEDVTKRLNPGHDFEYQFIDETYASSYKDERVASTLVNIFAFLSIIISCLGIYGLASYSADQRSKEIGVRKVHGSTVKQILVLLSKDYAKLMLLAFLLAIPFSYYISNNWLNNFEFRANLDPFLFFLAGFLVFIIGVVTVSLKSYHAATVNPIKSLRDE